jgi:hypothetical protein
VAVDWRGFAGSLRRIATRMTLLAA